jgi:hypothetical protein
MDVENSPRGPPASAFPSFTGSVGSFNGHLPTDSNAMKPDWSAQDASHQYSNASFQSYEQQQPTPPPPPTAPKPEPIPRAPPAAAPQSVPTRSRGASASQREIDDAIECAKFAIAALKVGGRVLPPGSESIWWSMGRSLRRCTSAPDRSKTWISRCSDWRWRCAALDDLPRWEQGESSSSGSFTPASTPLFVLHNSRAARGEGGASLPLTITRAMPFRIPLQSLFLLGLDAFARRQRRQRGLGPILGLGELDQDLED